jgi:hypothetical protein
MKCTDKLFVPEDPPYAMIQWQMTVVPLNEWETVAIVVP